MNKVPVSAAIASALVAAALLAGCSSAAQEAPAQPAGIAAVPTDTATPEPAPAETTEAAAPQHNMTDIERLRADLEPVWTGSTPLDDANVDYVITNACEDVTAGREVWVVNAETDEQSRTINDVIAAASSDYLCD